MKTLKRPKLGSALVSAVVFLTIIPFACAAERATAPAIVTQYCSGCHGIDGRSELPYVPRLAGLSAAYTQHKLASFRTVAASPVDEAFTWVAHIGSTPKDPGITAAAAVHMVGIAHVLTDEAVKAATQWYAARPPAHERGGKGKLIEEGRSLFTNGLESQGVRACQTCHGPEAEGTDKAPRLAGQNAAYVVGQLAHFRSGDGHNATEMSGVARYVERDQARAVAAYLQSR